jgi:hypothetical protein
MQLPEKYKENFDVSSEGSSSGVTHGSERRHSPYIIQVVASLRTKACSQYTGTDSLYTVFTCNYILMLNGVNAGIFFSS